MNIELKNLTKHFCDQSLVVLDASSFTFRAGRTYGLCGPSGSGKSTLLAMIAGFEKVSNGEIYFGSNIRSCDFLKKKISILFQDPHLLDELTVLENCMLRAYIVMSKTKNSAEAIKLFEEKVKVLLEDVGLVDKMHAMPYTLSGGERQRVALVRALAVEPLWLLADEPTAHLDQKSADRVVGLMCSYAKKYGMGVLMACHDPRYYGLLDQVCHIRDAKII